MKGYIKRCEANEPQKFPLNSEESEDFHLMLVSAHSDEFYFNKSLVQQRVAESVVGGEFKNKKALLHAQMVAAAVVDWSVPDEYGECNQDNAEKFLYEYPEIAEAVDAFISQNKNYIEKK